MKDKEILNKLQEDTALLKEKISVPASISPNAVHLSHTPKRSKRKWYVAAAAVFLIISISVFSLAGLILERPRAAKRSSQVIILPEATQQGAKSYDEVYNALKTYYDEQNKLTLRNFFNGIGKSDNFMAEDVQEATGAAPENGASKSSSSTNVQVEGVDEADSIKNDDRYIYYYKTVNEKGVICIFDALQPNNVVKLNDIALSDKYIYNVQMFLQKDRLIVVYNMEKEKVADEDTEDSLSYSTRCYWMESEVHAVVYDVSNPSSPELMRSFCQEGSVSDVRMVENNLFIVSSKGLFYSDGMKRENQESYIPKVYDSADESEKMLDSKCILIPEFVESSGYTIVTAVDTLSCDKKAETKAVLGSSNTVYATKDNLYLLSGIYEETGNSTNIQRFCITAGNVIATGAVSVPGVIINQFAADEYNGYFRIATTLTKNNTGLNTRPSTSNAMYVFDKDLKPSGSVENIAPGEQIYSVRFMGEKAYMVTFYQTDPLFEIDLSDPAHPTITGELKIPGFSRYLHPVTDGLMLGIGQDANEINGQTDPGIKLSLFDVSNFGEPKELDVKKLFTNVQWADSSAFYNHKTVVDLGEQKYGFPATVYSNSGNSQYFIIIKIADNAITIEKTLSHEAVDQEHRNELRGVRMGNTLVTIGEKYLVSFSGEDYTEQSRIIL